MYVCVQIKCLKAPRLVKGQHTHELELLTPVGLPLADMAVPAHTATTPTGSQWTVFSESTTIIRRDFPGWYEIITCYSLDDAYL